MDATQAREELTARRRRLDELGERARAEAPGPGPEEEGQAGMRSADLGTDVETRMEDLGLADDADRQREEIDAALARIEDGTWGTCEVCGQAIGDERLEARPQAVRCLEHQEQAERR